MNITEKLTENDYVDIAKNYLSTGAWRRALHFLNKADVLYPSPLDSQNLTKEAGWENVNNTSQLTKKEEREINYFTRKQEKYGFEASWSIYQIRAFAYPSPYKAKWMSNGVNTDIKVKLPNKRLSGLELWKYADELYKLLGDTEHRHIEGFGLNGDTLEVCFGS